ncbi:hypothetical protein EI94DRAFT_1753272 [Lactarius quietus]|nr:hypothetical protein EI94DRAFT_1753272 [Lactarius quietus]
MSSTSHIPHTSLSPPCCSTHSIQQTRVHHTCDGGIAVSLRDCSPKPTVSLRCQPHGCTRH